MTRSPSAPAGVGPAGRHRAGAAAQGAGRHLALVGPTASGKSALAYALAGRFGDIEIVSVDSMQVYRGMDIGTAKPSAQERARVAFHLIDVVDPSETYAVGAYQRAALEALRAIEGRGHRALLVGGTGLYLRALVDGLQLPGRYPAIRRALEAEVVEGGGRALHAELQRIDPLAASRIDPANERRTVRALEVCRGSGRAFSSFGPGLTAYPPAGVDLVALAWPRPLLDRRIAARYEAQVAAGFVGEVDQLLARSGGLGPTARQALGYRELLGHLEGALSLDAAVDQAIRRTRRFARRQERWFRRDPRVRWYRVDDDPLAVLPSLSEEWAPCA